MWIQSINTYVRYLDQLTILYLHEASLLLKADASATCSRYLNVVSYLSKN